MNVQEKKSLTLSNGNTFVYNILSSGTAYKEDTCEKVVDILERAMQKKTRIRFFYGHTDTGRDWCEEWGTIGMIARSRGDIFKIPLLIKTTRSYGGGSILDDRIVKITIDKQVVYQHPNYFLPKLEVKEFSIEEGYTHGVFMNDKNYANFKSLKQAENLVAFLKGETNRH